MIAIITRIPQKPMATKILKSINQSDVPTGFDSVNNSAKIQKTNPSDEDSK
jgi:hypothetical protein